MFLLDTNVYIAGFNNPGFGPSFREFHRERLPRIILSAVVVHELLIGALTARRQQTLDTGLVEPFRTRDRLHVPSFPTWKLTAEIDRRLRAHGGYEASLRQRSFGNNMLLAATARELGATLITLNLADFDLISQAVDFKYSAPWPKS